MNYIRSYAKTSEYSLNITFHQNFSYHFVKALAENHEVIYTKKTSKVRPAVSQNRLSIRGRPGYQWYPRVLR